jgi:peptidoglycan/xylan/chitin deacetylase (PgdA/CDA1 family)
MMTIRRKVLFRLDDYAANRDHEKWTKVLGIFNKFNIKVCVGVIPDNRDKNLLKYNSEPNSSFWVGVAGLEKYGHVIALHGCTHEYHSINKSESLIPVNPQSEFVGLEYLVQLDKLSRSLAIFSANGFSPKIFMAPSHTFDEVTLRCLSELGIKYVTDGYFFRPVSFSGIKFIPQQFGSLYRPMLPLQTICLHPNTIMSIDINQLEQYCSRYRDSIADFSVFDSLDYPPRGFFDSVIMRLFHLRFRI